MNGTELFEIVKTVSTFSEYLYSVNGKTPSETQSKRGNLYEKMWDIIIRFGCCEMFPNDSYTHVYGNINTCNMKRVDDLESYLHGLTIRSKGKGGSSDITLQHTVTEKWTFMSSKFYLDDSNQHINDYEVGKILAALKCCEHKYKEYEIYLLVNDKQKVKKIISASQSTNNHIKSKIHHILDLTDLERCFQTLKRAIQSIPIGEVNAVFCNPKVPLVLRFHQDLITHSIMNRISEGHCEFLLGAKARSGKTYCVGGLLIKFYRKNGVINALIITPSRFETIPQFTDDLFRKFQDFYGINIVEITGGSDFDTMVLQKNNIIIVSKQLLDGYVLEKTVETIRRLSLNLIVFDENHFHGTTQMSKDIFQSYSSPHTIKLYLTATFSKPLNVWAIPLECQFYWDTEDERMCKNRDIQKLIEIHGDDVLLFVNEKNKECVLSVYDKMPKLEIITNSINKEKYDVIKSAINDTSYGFCFKTLFCGKFQNEVDRFLQLFTGSNKSMDYREKDTSMFRRIKDMAVKAGSRTLLNNADFTTQLWFLPFGIGLKISNVSNHLKERMLHNHVLMRYEIKIVNSDKEYKQVDVKKEIENWEINAKSDGKDGLILLAGNQLTLGITLPLVDIVVLCNDVVSSDKIVQMMYRGMTESINTPEINKINRGVKKIGFVVDMNISRVLNTYMEYNVRKKNLSPDQKIEYLVENEIINIDSDLFVGRENKTKLIENLKSIWKSNPINNLKLLLRQIENTIIELDTSDQKQLNQYFTKSVGDAKVNVKVKFDDENEEEALPTGRKLIRKPRDCESERSVGEHDDDDDDDDDNVSITKDVLPFIILLHRPKRKMRQKLLKK